MGLFSLIPYLKKNHQSRTMSLRIFLDESAVGRVALE